MGLESRYFPFVGPVVRQAFCFGCSVKYNLKHTRTKLMLALFLFSNKNRSPPQLMLSKVFTARTGGSVSGSLNM